MCGRYTIYGPRSRIRERFGAEPEDDDLDQIPRNIPNPLGEVVARYNTAPSQLLPVVRAAENGRRVLCPAKWGLIPRWVKASAKLQQPINAKGESAFDKPMFRHAIRSNRVLVPACGFFEWQAGSAGKTPYYITMADGEPFPFGGLIEHWRPNEDAEPTVIFCILTTDPNELCATLTIGCRRSSIRGTTRAGSTPQ